MIRLPLLLFSCCLLIRLSLPAQVLVNQSGYNLRGPKRFTAPLAVDGTAFRITREGAAEVLYSGMVIGGAGDFTAFQPEDDEGPYVLHVEGNGSSFPYGIGDAWIVSVRRTASTLKTLAVV